MNECTPQTPTPDQRPSFPTPNVKPDWRRYEVAARRYGELIAAGVNTAIHQRTDIDVGTARCIAHVLGRSLGTDSALASFASTGDGDYEALREDYLSLHNDRNVTETTQQLIDWLGVHLIHQRHPAASTVNYAATYPPRLDNVLVPTGVEVGDWYLTVQVPGIYNAKDIDELTSTLDQLHVDQDPALRCFLGLPDVNAMSGDIMTDFHEQYIGTYASIEDAIDDVADVQELQRDLTDYASERQLIIEHMTPDYEALRPIAAEGYDFVEEEGRVYVFSK